jgi:ABC-2 type transport system ATP-binding protein
MAAISISHLTKTYRSGFFGGPGIRALDGVSLEVPEGSIFGLLGPNGAGKTTLVKILLGLVSPTDGEAELLGTPVQSPAARRRVGFLPEHHRVPGFLTAAQALQVYGRLADVPAKPRTRRLEILLEKVGLEDQADAKVHTFSKGMLQRLGLAQALLNQPDLLFLDEPTSGVDPVGRRGMRDLVLDLRDDGVTIFLNSHLLSEVEKVCTQVAILREGRLVRTGRMDELTAADQGYDLEATPIPERVLESLPITSASTTPSDPSLVRYRLHVDDRRHLNAVLDQLRSHDVEIASLAPPRRSLEDYFVDAVEPEPPPSD